MFIQEFLLKKEKKKYGTQSWVTKILNRSVNYHFPYDWKMANIIPVVRKV